MGQKSNRKEYEKMQEAYAQWKSISGYYKGITKYYWDLNDVYLLPLLEDIKLELPVYLKFCAMRPALKPLKIAKARKKLELEICKVEERASVIENDIQAECCKEDVDFEHIIKLHDDLALMAHKARQYKHILETMFEKGEDKDE